MIQILLGIIALAIFGYLAIISIPVIGDALTGSSTSGLASATSNQLQQIQGALIASRARGNAPTVVDDLVTSNYLTNNPAPPYGQGASAAADETWELYDDTAGSGKRAVAAVFDVTSNLDDGITTDVCDEINANSTGSVGCLAITPTDKTAPTVTEVGGAIDTPVAVSAVGDVAVVYMTY